MELSEEQQPHNGIIVKKVNFDTNVFNNERNKISVEKQQYRFNDIKIDLSSLVINDPVLRKSPCIRVQIALRDTYGIVYDTIYKAMCDSEYHFE